MAIREGQYNFSPLQAAQNPNVGQILAEVGRQLNERYYQNRQAYVNNIANPIANIKVADRDRELYNSIMDGITEQGNQFKETNDWSQATSYIFDATESILTNEALKAMQTSYATEQQYKEDLKASGWDSRMQSAFMLRSQIQSEAINYDSDIILSGGFNPVAFGKPIDIQSKYKQISDIVSKVKASGTEVKSISANDALAQGLAQTLNLDGEQFVSNFLSSTYATEGVSYETIANYAKSVLEADPEYLSYLSTIAENEAFLTRYNPATKTVDDWQPQHLRQVYSDSYTLVSLLGHGLPISDIGALKPDGSFALNPNMSEDTQTALNLLSATLGFDFRDLLSGKTINVQGEARQALEQYLTQGFDEYVNGNLQTYLSNLGVKESDDASPYIDQWYQQQITNDYVQSTVNSFADSTGKLLSYQKTKTYQELVSNQTPFARAMKIKEDRRGEIAKNAAAGIPTLASMPDIVADSQSTKDLIERRQALGDTLAKAQIDRDGIIFTTQDYNALGINPNDPKAFSPESVNDINIDAWAAAHPELANSVEHKNLINKVKQYQRNSDIINSINTEIQHETMNLEKVLNAYQEDKSLYGRFSGTGGVSGLRERFILDYGITSYEDYERVAKDIVDNGSDSDKNRLRALTGTGYGFRSDADVQNSLQNAIDVVTNNYKSKYPNDPISYATKADIVFNPSASTEQFMNTGIAAIATANGDWVLEGTNNGKISNVVLSDPELARLFTIQGTTVSTTTNSKGQSVTASNNPVSKFEGIKGDKLGIKEKIYGVQWNPIFDPSGITASGGRKFKMQATFLGQAGEYLGDAVVSRDITEQTYNQLLQDNYTQGYKYNLNNPETIGDNVFAESAGKIAVQATQSIFKFDAASGETDVTYGANVNSLQERLSGISVDKPIYTDMDITLPYNGLSIGKMRLEVSKVGTSRAGTVGYKVRAVTKGANGQYIDASTIDLGSLGLVRLPTLADDAPPVQNISDALIPLSNQLLEIGSLIQISNTQR